MSRVLTVIVLLSLLGLCVFGLLATLEPDDSGSQLTWRWVYGSGALCTAVLLVGALVGPPKDKGSA